MGLEEVDWRTGLVGRRANCRCIPAEGLCYPAQGRLEFPGRCRVWMAYRP